MVISNKSINMTAMYTEEGIFLEKCMQWLAPQRRNGIFAFKVRDRYAVGYSDIFICVHGILVVAELKDNKGTASLQQLDFIKKITEAGGIGGVCRSIQDVSDLIERVKIIRTTGG